ncbi:MAG: hypothetical protein V3V16_14405 [Melioribacteraceae bacterium]
MEQEYDFSKATRGKFFNENVKLNLPVYLDVNNLLFVEKIAKKKNLDITVIVNELIKENIRIAKVLR